MSGIIYNGHVQHLILNTPGQIPTIPSPPTITPESPLWNNATDILIGELALNKADGIWYSRDESGIIFVSSDSHFRGVFISLVALQTAIPTGNSGDYAVVDSGLGSTAAQYIWDADDGWVIGTGSGGVMSFNGRVGNVTPVAGDYPPAFIGAQPANAFLTNIANTSWQNGDFGFVEGGNIVRKTTEEVRKILRTGRLLSNPYTNAGNTGNTNENIIGTIILVPAGTIEANDGLRMWGKIQSGAANAKTFRTYVNTTPDLTGTPVQILAWTVTNSLTVPFVRNYTQRGLINSMSGLNIGSPGTISDEANTAINNSNFTVDWTVDQYIIRTMQNANGADNMVLLQHFIQLLKAP